MTKKPSKATAPPTEAPAKEDPKATATPLVGVRVKLVAHGKHHGGVVPIVSKWGTRSKSDLDKLPEIELTPEEARTYATAFQELVTASETPKE